MPTHDPNGTPRLVAAPKVNMPTPAPARKVVGASAGAGIGGVTAGLVLWGLDDYVFQPHVANSVPGAVTAFVIAVVPLALSFVGGYITKRSASELARPGVTANVAAHDYADFVRQVKSRARDASLDGVPRDTPEVPPAKPAAKKTAAKRPAKKAAPKSPGLS